MPSAGSGPPGKVAGGLAHTVMHHAAAQSAHHAVSWVKVCRELSPCLHPRLEGGLRFGLPLRSPARSVGKAGGP